MGPSTIPKMLTPPPLSLSIFSMFPFSMSLCPLLQPRQRPFTFSPYDNFLEMLEPLTFDFVTWVPFECMFNDRSFDHLDGKPAVSVWLYSKRN